MKTMMEKLEYILDFGGMKKDILFLIIGAVSLLCSIFHFLSLPFDAAWLAIVFCGIPIIMEAVIGLVTEFDIKADVLVAIALIASVIIGEYFAAGEVAFIMQLGGFLEELTVARARAGIEKLVKLTPTTARIMQGDSEVMVPAEQVLAGAMLRVLPGETIPVDGILTKGTTAVDQSVITGESIPVDKEAGDEVYSGTVNQHGAFEMKANKAGEDSSMQRMVRLVQSADAGKAEIVSMADKWATWVVITAMTAAVLTFLVTHEILRSVTILVVFCPCALVLATPTAIMAAIGNCTRHGFLVREGDALERLSYVAKICFDKTGTLTLGKPKVVGIEVVDDRLEAEEIYRLTASAEKNSEHPLGRAIVSSYRENKKDTLPEAVNFEMLAGRGVKAQVEGKEILAGNQKLLEEYHISFASLQSKVEEYLQRGCTLIYVCIDGKAAAVLALSDVLRMDTKAVMNEIRASGAEPVLLTGDNEKAASFVGHQLDISKVKAACLPEDKLRYIRESQEMGNKVCMIGDGVNDAPALKTAYVGLAMGGVGSDIAVDAADIVLVNDEIRAIPHLLRLSRRMMFAIKCNLTFSMGLNILAIILAITGVLNPVAGALVHNSGSVLVILHSALLLGWKKK